MYRLGVVPYLNAVPLTAGLPPGVTCHAGDPAALSQWLAEGRVDAALLPTAEAIRGVGGGPIGRFGIACEGPVASVLAFHPVEGADPAAWPKDVVLDPASRTSVALLRVLLERRHGLSPRYTLADAPGPDPRSRPDAMTLCIGDAAMRRRKGWTGGVLDLGRAWKEWTGLPFVFARWTARAGLPDADREALARTLDTSAQRGLEQRDDLAARHASAAGLTPAEARHYLSTSIRFAIGERSEAGIRRFADEVAALAPLPAS
jgi:chorismate dehydratase